MAKLTAWIVTLIGAVMVLGLLNLGFDWSTPLVQWALALAVLVVGIGKLLRNYSSRKRR